MDLHTTSEEIAWGLDLPLISVAPDVRYALQIRFVLPSGNIGTRTVTGPWRFLLEMLEFGPTYWDTVNVIDLTIRKLDGAERHYKLDRDSAYRTDV